MNYLNKLGLKISANSFARCYIDIGSMKPGTDAMSVFKDKLDWPEFRRPKYPSGEFHHTQIIKYIVCFYDPNSPFAHLDWEERKLASAEYVAFRKNEDGGYTEAVQAIMNCEVDAIRAMIIRYCRAVRSPEYATYKVLEMNYHTKVLTAPTLKITEIQKDLIALQGWKNQFLAGDDNKQLREHFYRVVSEEEQEAHKLRPEVQHEQFGKNISSVTLNTIGQDEEDRE